MAAPDSVDIVDVQTDGVTDKGSRTVSLLRSSNASVVCAVLDEGKTVAAAARDPDKDE
jgi:hypothetical protein